MIDNKPNRNACVSKAAKITPGGTISRLVRKPCDCIIVDLKLRPQGLPVCPSYKSFWPDQIYWGPIIRGNHVGVSSCPCSPDASVGRVSGQTPLDCALQTPNLAFQWAEAHHSLSDQHSDAESDWQTGLPGTTGGNRPSHAGRDQHPEGIVMLKANKLISLQFWFVVTMLAKTIRPP